MDKLCVIHKLPISRRYGNQCRLCYESNLMICSTPGCKNLVYAFGYTMCKECNNKLLPKCKNGCDKPIVSGYDICRSCMMRDYMSDSSVIKNISDYAIERNNDPEFYKRFVETMKEVHGDPTSFHKDPEFRGKVSNTLKRLWREDRDYQMKMSNRHANYHGGMYYSYKLSKEIHYRSSYEKDAYKLLDWIHYYVAYETEPFVIPFEYDGETHSYLPDILTNNIDGTQSLIEIKPYDLIYLPENQAKFKAGRDFCNSHNMTYHIWTEDILYPKERCII